MQYEQWFRYMIKTITQATVNGSKGLDEVVRHRGS